MVKSNGTFDLMKAMQEMEARLSKQLGEVQSSVSTALAEVDGVKETHETFRKSLLEPGGRVAVIEEDITWQGRSQWFHSLVVIPILAALHAIAYQLGWKW